MGSSEREAWVTYLEGDCLNQEIEGGGRVYQVVMRVRPEGLQGIVKVRKDREYLVQFIGAGSLPSFAGKLRDTIKGPPEKWRPDAYPPV